LGGRRLDGAGLVLLREALADEAVLSRYLSKIVTVPGSGCCWWTGAISGRGHGRFWYAPGRVTIAHRFGFALARGVDVLAEVPVLGHRCDNPLCQRMHPQHVVASSYAENRREWAVRKQLAGSPLGHPHGSRARARQLRDLARADPGLVADELAGLLARYGEQEPLW
jgi:hypothetical protein